MSAILQIQGLINSSKQKQQQEQCPQCPQTRICIWQDDSFQQMETDYLNQVFPEKLNKKTMSQGVEFIFHFLSSSLYYWIELRQDKEKLDSQKLSMKDAKFISQVLKQTNVENDIAFNRWGQFFNKKDQFQQKIKVEAKFKVPSGGKLVHKYSRNTKEHGQQQFQIVKYKGNNKQLAQYKKRFQVIFLFYIDGVSYVWDQQQQWIYYIIYRVQSKPKQNGVEGKENGVSHKNQNNNQNKNINHNVDDGLRRHFVGVLSKYDFRISLIKERHRISQVLILPCYQKLGHGKQLLDQVYKESLQDPNCFEITTQGPSFEFQCLRDYKQAQMILKQKSIDLSKIKSMKTKDDIIKNREFFLATEKIRNLKTSLKLPGHQIQRLVNIFLYHYIMTKQKQQSMAVFQEDLRQRIIYNRSVFKSRKKQPHISVYGQTTQIKDFMIQKEKQDYLRNQGQIQQILSQNLDGYRRIIGKLQKLKLLD